VPEKLLKSGRAPSHKAIALAILKNDVSMSSLGFAPKTSKYYYLLKEMNKKHECEQLELRL